MNTLSKPLEEIYLDGYIGKTFGTQFEHDTATYEDRKGIRRYVKLLSLLNPQIKDLTHYDPCQLKFKPIEFHIAENKYILPENELCVDSTKGIFIQIGWIPSILLLDKVENDVLTINVPCIFNITPSARGYSISHHYVTLHIKIHYENYLRYYTYLYMYTKQFSSNNHLIIHNINQQKYLQTHDYYKNNQCVNQVI